MGRTLRTLGCTLVLGMTALAGCISDTDTFNTDDDPDVVGVVPRSQVQNVDTAFDVQFYSTAGGYIGEVLAVCGYNFNRIASSNRVVIDSWDCRVLNYVELDNGSRFGALFFQIPSTIPTANARKLNVLSGGNDSSRRPLLDVHRFGYAGPSTGTTIVANDISNNPPTWQTAHDFTVPSKPDTMDLSPDGGYAYLTAADSLYLALLADGQLVIRADTFFSGNTGPTALSPDGKLFIAGTFPAAPAAPELQVVDTSFVESIPLAVNAANGIVAIGGGTAPVFAAPTTVSLGGAFPGKIAFSPDSSKVYVTLSSSIVREYTVSGTTLTQNQDYAIGGGTAPFGIAVNANWAVVTDIANGTVVPIDLTTGTVATALTGGSTPLIPVITSNGLFAVVVNVGGTDYSLYDIGTSAIAAHSPATLSLGASPGPIAISPDGPLGSAASNQILAINGNQLNYININFSTGAISLAGYSTGPYAQSLNTVAVSPKR